ncbi:hypothetical protein [Candidatus Synechococcus calcipolaris]|nr:hypothetical protein [Candidatus Synechococcus calcipolaris]
MVMVLLTLDSGNLDLIAGLLAIAIVIGGFLMMFTNLWTKR